MQIAYFSAEFGLRADLPIYSGGLGLLAGDHVKAAADLGLDLVAVGVLYRKGYFRQRLSPDGEQEALYPELRPEELPLCPVLTPGGEPLTVGVPMGGRTVWLRVWEARVGAVPVYLMDADIPANCEADRQLTDHLYGGGQAIRIAHEIILGIGGVRVVRALGLRPDVWHLNEGHVAFLTLERIREYSARGVDFATALEAVRANTLFTTHTPVPAGHDVFPAALVDQFLGDYYWQLGATREQVLSLGEDGHGFNMTRLAHRTASFVNGVSRLHGEVTRQLFQRWTPALLPDDLAVSSVTNGVHTATWLGPELRALFDRFLENGWLERAVWAGVVEIPGGELWAAHQAAKARLIRRLGLPAETQTSLLIGFARRFATYKRATLLFADLERAAQLFSNPDRPLYAVFAGKAHPADGAGQALIRRLAELSRRPPFAGRLFLVEDYDIELAQHLVQGADLWLNNPVKPLEASGTSGMKATLNGVLNCSVLDGWWAEGYNGLNGWAIGGPGFAGLGGLFSREDHDRLDATSLYQLLEQEILPLYYGDPAGWIERMRESIRTLAPVYSTAHMVAEYRDRFYQPLAERGRRFRAGGLEVAYQVARYKEFMRRNWPEVRIEAVERWGRLRALIRLGPVWHPDVRVEAIGTDWRCELQVAAEPEPRIYWYEAPLPPASSGEVRVRVYPVSPDFSSDFELELVTWA